MAGTATLESGRSLRPLYIASLILSILGIGVAGYLTYVHYADISPICAGGSGGCEKVQASDQSKLAGIPVALLGLLTYITLLVLNLLRGELARTGAALVAIIGFGFSAYLTIESVTVIKATCQWCLSSLAIMTLMAIVTAARLVRGRLRLDACSVARGRSASGRLAPRWGARTCVGMPPIPPPPRLRIDFDGASSGGVVLRLEGELDAATAPELERRLTGLPTLGRVLVLDLHELSFLDSLGLNMLFRAREWALTRGRGAAPRAGAGPRAAAHRARGDGVEPRPVLRGRGRGPARLIPGC